ncbi:NPCBM/NEW2 domain-containing protein [Streptomyces katsurahamanus]|uniref:Alpha-galactosidase n=1 Tax=Streptomyces katsurahamanus TaxID=2577098 RepID=A0ABW9NRB7_9ACTN|nr:NPCBM/NEW2 domain-containing protein [Streptomyces katsurahamanus]MQS35788.1 alpha-galactosidase [Streptomyces katsurahamanus]
MRHLSVHRVRTGVVGALITALLGAAGLSAPAAALSPDDPTAPAGNEADAQVGAQTGTRTGTQTDAQVGEALALTPPMGFNNWNSTHCRADFNESMIKGIADIFVERGLKEAGYTYVNLDDCWALPQRNAKGRLVPDPVRFPNGIKAVADYVHSKELKFGIYTSAGTKTCNRAGFPGALGHEYSDAQQFADWGVDYLKYDNCNNQGVDARLRYTTMRDALLATSRPIVFSICEWGQNRPWEWAKGVGQLWRTTGDISDNWGSMLSIMKRNLALAPYAGPGHWNDPDMLEVGNGGMTDTEYRTHFSMWSIMAAPLLIGSDLRKVPESAFEILGNREVIAVDQDPLGRQGAVIGSEGGRWVVARELADGSRAVALFNESGRPQRIATTAQAVGLPAAAAYKVRDLWRHTSANTAGTIAATVPAHGTVLLRISQDRGWALLPPAVEVGADDSVMAESGRTAKLTATVTDLGRTPALAVSAKVTGPQGWTVKAVGRTAAPVLTSGAKLTTEWEVTVPADASAGTHELTVAAAYHSPTGKRLTASVPASVSVVVAPPAGRSYLSDLSWLSAVNGWGPVEKDTSNGESRAGDGRPITIGGQVFAKGLGVHASSTVEYYAGGRCTGVSASAGVDDEKGSRGTVAFEIWADGVKAASTGVLTNAMSAQPVSADVTGAKVVRLVVTDGGDGIDSDHADWADLTISC